MITKNTTKIKQAIRFNLQKIIRNKLPLKLDRKGIGYRIRYLVGHKYIEGLINKLREELDELIKAENDTERAMEAGDMIQVVHGFANYYSFHLSRLTTEDTEETLDKATEDFINTVKNNGPVRAKAQKLVSKILHYIKPIDMQQVEEERLSKLANHGDFSSGIFLEYMDLPQDDPRVEIFLKDPEKYRPVSFVTDY